MKNKKAGKMNRRQLLSAPIGGSAAVSSIRSSLELEQQRPFRRRSNALLRTLLLLVPSFSAYPQDAAPLKVEAGDSQVSGAFIKPYKNLWRLTYSKPGREPLDAASWSDEVQAVKIGERTMFKRTQIARYKTRDLTSTLINVFDPQTLVPVSRDFKQSDGTHAHIDFGDHSITYERQDKPGTEVMKGQKKLDVAVYDFFGGMYGLLLAAFPLKEGLTATLPSLDEQKNEVRWATFKVVRKEMVEAGPGKQVEAWLVETDDNGPMTFWLTKEPPYVFKLVYVAPGGVTATYTII